MPRRFATREELLGLLRALGEELGRTPTARDLDARRGAMPSKSLYWHTFGSLANALREAGFDVPVGEERLERAVEQGAALARRLGRLPKFADWAAARKADAALLTEWQVYRMFDVAPRVGDVPVPRARAAARGRRRRGRGRERRLGLARAGGERDRREPLQAELALVRRAHGGEGRLLDEGAVGREALAPRDAAVLDARAACPRRPRACAASGRSVARRARARARVEAKKSSRPAVPSQSGRPMPRARKRTSGVALVEPGGRHRAVQLLERPGLPSACSARAKIASESTVISGWARSKPCARRSPRR